MEQQPFRSLYSIIPARVRDDPELRPNGKLLYAELSALAQAKGYAWASNAYLAEVMKLSQKTIEALIKQLRDRGHISTDVVRDEDTQCVEGRKIWICGPPGSAIEPPLKNKGWTAEPPLKNEGTHPSKIRGGIIKELIPPYNPPTGEPSVRKRKRSNEPKKAPDWKPERFADFWKAYPCGKSKQAAIKAWDKLKPDEDLLRLMALGLQRDLQSDTWGRGIGIPYASTWLNNRRWEDEDKPPLPVKPEAKASRDQTEQVQTCIVEEEGTYRL